MHKATFFDTRKTKDTKGVFKLINRKQTNNAMTEKQKNTNER